MRMQLCLLLAGLFHHAFAAEFDVNKPVKVSGTVTKVEFTNPHAWLYVDVKEPDGKMTNWRFELGAPNALIRLGWRTDTIKAGTEVRSQDFEPRPADRLLTAARSSYRTAANCLAGDRRQRSGEC